MKNNDFVCIPNSFMIVVDDVGWWCGNDHRFKNGPSRSGMGRRHCVEDYKAIIEIGRSLNMRIKCGFIAGEWDRNNIIAKVRNSNKYGAEWDNASRLDPQIDEVRDIINAGSDYIEMALHGILHMYWTDEGIMKAAEFFQQCKKTGKNIMTPPNIIREHLDAYFEILLQNGFSTDVKSFIPPCFIYTYSHDNDGFSAILAEYGIKYVSTIFECMEYKCKEKPVDACVENGIITVDRTCDVTDWNIADAPTPDIIKKSYYGMHWPHFLNMDPDKNTETVKRWIEYFAQYKNKFDILPARDNAIGSTQTLYKRFTDFNFMDDKLELNFKVVDTLGVKGLDKSFYINVLNTMKPIEDETIELSIYETHDEYTTYKVTRRKPFSTRSIVKFKIVD